MVIGPTGGVPGDILLLDASQSVGDHFTWQVTPEEQKPTILVLENGRKCLVRSVAGAYVVFCSVSNAEGNDSLKHAITVSDKNTPPVPPGPLPAPPPGPAPDPPSPPPTPGPNPEPVFPPGEFGAASKVFSLARAVNSPTRGAAAQRLALAWQQVQRDLVDSKKLSGLVLAAKVQQLMSAAGSAALGADKPAWKSFEDGLEGPILELYNSQRLLSADDWSRLLGEAITGLQAVR